MFTYNLFLWQWETWLQLCTFYLFLFNLSIHVASEHMPQCGMNLPSIFCFTSIEASQNNGFQSFLGQLLFAAFSGMSSMCDIFVTVGLLSWDSQHHSWFLIYIQLNTLLFWKMRGHISQLQYYAKGFHHPKTCHMWPFCSQHFPASSTLATTDLCSIL